jgi:hypothetical protein
MDSAPGHHTDMRPLLLELVEPEGMQPEKNLNEK